MKKRQSEKKWSQRLILLVVGAFLLSSIGLSGCQGFSSNKKKEPASVNSFLSQKKPSISRHDD